MPPRGRRRAPLSPSSQDADDETCPDPKRRMNGVAPLQPEAGPPNQVISASDEAGPSGTTDSSSQGSADTPSRPMLSLVVKWHGHGNGPNRVHHLNLKNLASVDTLKGLSRSLIDRAFAEDQPQHLSNEEYYNFTPTEECMSFPPGTTRTEFKLVTTTEDGWEYVVLNRELGGQLDPERKLLITVIEFESTAVMIGHLAVRLSLVAYPLVSVKKTFLDEIEQQLRDPNSNFKGILS